MKRVALGIIGAVLALAAPVWAQRNPRGTAKLTLLDGKTNSVEYGRPSLNGRAVSDLMAGLKPGDVWRLGADQSATFSTTGELSLGNVKIPVIVPR